MNSENQSERNTDQPEQHPVSHSASLGVRDQVRASLSHYVGIPADRIYIPDNSEKYGSDGREDDSLNEVFDIMWKLNESALSSSTIGATGSSCTILPRALDLIVDDIIYHCQGMQLQYVELGPEPSKTAHILNRLVKAGIDIQRYTAVDINPASRAVMIDEVSRILPRQIIDSQNSLFGELHTTDYRMPNTIKIYTMLGFEEGTEHPCVVAEMLGNLLDQRDLFLSEMQLLSKTGCRPIVDFYHTDLMRRFSEISLQREFPGARADYAVHLVPVELQDALSPVMVVVAGELLYESDSDDSRAWRMLVTHYSTRPSNRMFREQREADGKMSVIAERSTSDESISFQLAMRTSE